MYIHKKEIHLEKAGTLKSLIVEHEKEYVTHLKLTGYLNLKDFDVLDDMCTSNGEFDEDDNYTNYEEVPPFLKELDLGECVLVDNFVWGEFTFYSKLEKVILPKKLESTGDMSVFENSIYLKTVVAPESLKEYGYGTFMNCDKLENVNFPARLERIGGFSFCGCSAIKSIKISANVSIIESAAFGGCYNLEKFEIDKHNNYFTVVDGVLYNKDKTRLVAFPCGYHSKHYSVPEGVKIIGNGAFLDSQITSISFPSTLETIEGWAFRFCRNLVLLDIPDSVTEIGEVAFNFCSALTHVKLPNKIVILKRLTFGSCQSLKEIDIPASVQIIENTALGWSGGLESIFLHDGLLVLNDLTQCKVLKHIVIPKTVKEIASGIFRHCSSMNSINIDNDNPYFCTIDGSLYSKDKTNLIAVPYNENKNFIIPNEVKVIQDFVFDGFDKLEQLILPEMLQIVGHRTFEECKGLKSLHFSKYIKSIDFRAFDDCVNLQIIEIVAETPPKITNPPASCWKFIKDAKEVTLYVPKESLKKYKKAFGWKDIKNIEVITQK